MTDDVAVAIILLLTYVAGLFFSRYLYKLNIITLGDFYRMRYNRTVEVITSLCIVGSYLGWVAAQIKALGLDNGAWRVTPEGEFCGKWTKLRNGAESCAPVVDLGGGTYQWGNSKFRILSGNPRSL